MKNTLSNQFLKNYIIMFVISIVIFLITFIILDFSNHMVSSTLTKNIYTADKFINDDYTKIDTSPILENGGGVQVITSDYKVVLSKGIDNIGRDALTPGEFTEFLVNSKANGIPYNYDIKYNDRENFWLIVTFPTSLRIGFDIAYNDIFASKDKNRIIGILISIIILYLILLGISTLIYSKLTSISITNPLKKLCNSAKLLRNGNYSTRVNLNLKNEFGELQDTFNSMAEEIETQLMLKNKSEENRKKMILDISHDLKNPLSSIIGYSELCLNKDLPKESLLNYIKIIQSNGIRSNKLITDLFELSKLDSPEFKLNLKKVDICEYIRQVIGSYIYLLDDAGFSYDFNIPEEEIFLNIDTYQMNRVFQNLIVNSVNYNPPKTNVIIKVLKNPNTVTIIFKDNGVGIPKDISSNVFKEFIKVNSENKLGTGLGLSIVNKIINLHNGEITLNTDKNLGCEFIIKIKSI